MSISRSEIPEMTKHTIPIIASAVNVKGSVAVRLNRKNATEKLIDKPAIIRK